MKGFAYSRGERDQAEVGGIRCGARFVDLSNFRLSQEGTSVARKDSGEESCQEMVSTRYVL